MAAPDQLQAPTYEIEMAQIVHAIWNTVLELGILPIDPAHARALERDSLAGCVHITGAWNGSVALHVSEPLARRAASIFFSVAPERATRAEIDDALGELTNMAGGNIKALLPEPCRLSLPTVVPAREHARQVAGRREVSEVAFECLGEPLRVTLYERMMALV